MHHPLLLTLPIPPITNNTYQNYVSQSKEGQKRYGRRMSDVARKWKHDAMLITQSERNRTGFSIDDDTWAGMEITSYLRKLSARDVDSGMKLCMDAVTEALGIDDVRVVDKRERKHMVELGHEPYITVKLWTIPQWD